MTSDFIDVLGGFLEYDDESWIEVKNSDEMKAEISSLGEDRAKRAGAILEVSKDGYYKTEACIKDSKKVSTQYQVD